MENAMREFYILDKKRVVKSKDVSDWANKMNTIDRIVKQTTIGFVLVSTVFLGVNIAASGPPLLFETRVFGGKHDEYQRKYSTWSEAVKGHSEVCKIVFKL
jgi:hypothetical protein